MQQLNNATKSNVNKVRAKLSARQTNTSQKKSMAKKQKQKSMTRMTNGMSKMIMVDAPVARATQIQLGTPKIQNTTNGSIRVSHMEQITTVNGSRAFAVTGYSIQPGNPIMFPWLNNVALLYETYTINRLEFIYVSARSSATDGTIYLATDYDAYDTAPINSQQLNTYKSSMTGQPWLNLKCLCNTADLQKIKIRYNRFGGGVVQGDLKTYDAGTFFFATEMCADASALGKLFVSYDITFQTPQYDLTAYSLLGSNRTQAGTGPTPATPFGVGPVQAGGMTLGYSSVTNIFTVPIAGQYMLLLNITGTVLTALNVNATGNTTIASFNNIGFSATAIASVYTIFISAPGDGFQVVCAGTTVNTANIRIARYPTSLG